MTHIPNPLRGAALMVMGILMLSFMDVGAKAASDDVPVLQISFIRFAVQTVFLAAILMWQRQPMFPTTHRGTHLMRGVMQAATTFLFFSGVALMHLASATALVQLNPIFIAVGGVIFLKEVMGWRRWLAIGVALTGALIVSRPGTDVFTTAAFFPIAGSLCYAAYSLLTRVTRDTGVLQSLFVTGFVALVIFAAIMPWVWIKVPAAAYLPLGAVAFCGTAAHYAIIKAFADAPASALAPFGYSGLVFSMIFSTIFFQQVPDTWTIVGGIVIVGSGLYVWRQTQLQAQAK